MGILKVIVLSLSVVNLASGREIPSEGICYDTEMFVHFNPSIPSRIQNYVKFYLFSIAVWMVKLDCGKDAVMVFNSGMGNV